MPAAYTNWVENAFGWTQANWPSIFIPIDCTPWSASSRFRMWLLVKALAPLVLIFVVAGGTVARKAARHGWNVRNFRLGFLKAMPFALFLSFCACPSVSMSIFQSWLCVMYEYDGRGVDKPVIGHKYLRDDLHIRCTDEDFINSEHDRITSLALSLVFVW
jgi:hypothetical protein